MQSEKETKEATSEVMGHLLADMRDVSWEQAIKKGQSFLSPANPPEAIIAALGERFALDELHIKDVRNPNHPPHFSLLDDGALHIILRFPAERETDVEGGDVASVSILADDRMCVLIWPGERYHRFTKKELVGLSVEECACKIIHVLLDHLLWRVYILLEAMEEFEDECFTDVGKADLGQLLQMRKELAALARMARNNAIVLEKIKADRAYRDNLHLADAHEHMHRAAALAEARAEHALNVMQAIQSLLSQRLNDVMRFLAVITVILTPMGVIAGIFGMNFTHMEVLTHPSAFALTIWGMLMLGIGLAVAFKIRKWW